jgi:hypothetical protein
MDQGTESVVRPGLADVDLPHLTEWVSFWIDGRRHTVVADEPGVWTLLRHRKKTPTVVATFTETNDWFVGIDAEGRALGSPAPSWRALVLRYV